MLKNLNLFHLPHYHQEWIIWASEGLFTNGFVSPSPKVPTCHHENRLPIFLLLPKVFVVQVFEDPIPAIRRRKN